MQSLERRAPGNAVGDTIARCNFVSLSDWPCKVPDISGSLTTEPARERTAWSLLTPVPWILTAAAFPFSAGGSAPSPSHVSKRLPFPFFCKETGCTDDVSVLLSCVPASVNDPHCSLPVPAATSTEPRASTRRRHVPCLTPSIQSGKRTEPPARITNKVHNLSADSRSCPVGAPFQRIGIPASEMISHASQG